MRVLHVMTSLSQLSGGPLRAILDLSAQGMKLGLESEIVGFGPVEIPDNPLSTDRIHSLTKQWPKRYSYSPEFGPWLEQNLCRFDGVVLHGLWEYPQWLCSRICRRKGIPYACFPHGMLDAFPLGGHGRWKKLKKWTYWHCRERKIIEQARMVMFTTARELEDSSTTFKFQNRSRLVTPYGVQLPMAQEAHPERLEIVQPEGRRVALFLGRIHPIKNVDFLIDAWAKAALPESWHLVLAGPGDPRYLSRLLKQVKQLGLGDRVHFTGNVAGSDKLYLFQRSDWLLLPSKHENFGVVVLEAIHSRCAVALSTEVYLSECFAGFPGAAILPLNTETWVEFMRTKMLNDEWRHSWAEHCCEVVKRAYSMETVASNWINVLGEIFGV